MKKIQHHFVSETYLNNFTNQDNKIFVLDDNDKIFPTNPNNIFKENHYNTVNGSLYIENNLSELEGFYNNILKNKIIKFIKLSEEEKMILALYFATIFNRVRIRREGMEKSLTDLVNWVDSFKNSDLPSAPISSSGKFIDIKKIKKALENFNPEFAASSFNTSLNTAGIIYQMKWRFLYTDSGDNFLISSDNPSCLCRPVAENKYGPNAFGSRAGLLHKDSELTIPLTPKIIVLTGWINNTDLDYIPMLDTLVNQFNYRTLRDAKWIVSNKKEKLDDIRKKYPYKQKITHS